MYLLAGRWRGGYPRYHRHPGQMRIRVMGWIRLHRVDDAYLAPSRSWRLVVDYVGAYGLVQTWRKVRSRLAERGRNRKYVAFGWGETVAPEPRAVAFLAPFHPECVAEVCVDEELVRTVGVPGGENAVDPGNGWPRRIGAVLHGTADDQAAAAVAGWSRFSGRGLDRAAADRLLLRWSAAAAAGHLPTLAALPLPPSGESPGDMAPAATPPRPQRHDRPAAVLFGLGHYAKNVVVPRLSRHLDLACIHEIDPAQVGPVADRREQVRTSAFPEPDEDYPVYLVAGYHHTHAAIAVHALRRGAAVVVEKPPVTRRDQLADLMAALEDGGGLLFVAYQRRYSRLDDHLRADLAAAQGEPVHCQAVVYEIPLPANHWYRWPTSGSRLVSNGCHWIDHFLHLNDYVEPSHVRAHKLGNGDVVATVELVNSAALSLTITEHGSARLGVRDVVHFRAGEVTVRVVDQRLYEAESSRRRLRRDRVSARHAYDRMYETIGRRIRAGGSGDSLQSLRVGCEVMLAAEEALLADGATELVSPDRRSL